MDCGQQDGNQSRSIEHCYPAGSCSNSDYYRQVLGPTPDETVLVGLQTIADACKNRFTSSPPTEEISQPCDCEEEIIEHDYPDETYNQAAVCPERDISTVDSATQVITIRDEHLRRSLCVVNPPKQGTISARFHGTLPTEMSVEQPCPEECCPNETPEQDVDYRRTRRESGNSQGFVPTTIDPLPVSQYTPPNERSPSVAGENPGNHVRVTVTRNGKVIYPVEEEQEPVSLQNAGGQGLPPRNVEANVLPRSAGRGSREFRAQRSFERNQYDPYFSGSHHAFGENNNCRRPRFGTVQYCTGIEGTSRGRQAMPTLGQRSGAYRRLSPRRSVDNSVADAEEESFRDNYSCRVDYGGRNPVVNYLIGLDEHPVPAEDTPKTRNVIQMQQKLPPMLSRRSSSEVSPSTVVSNNESERDISVMRENDVEDSLRVSGDLRYSSSIGAPRRCFEVNPFQRKFWRDRAIVVKTQEKFTSVDYPRTHALRAGERGYLPARESAAHTPLEMHLENMASRRVFPYNTYVEEVYTRRCARQAPSHFRESAKAYIQKRNLLDGREFRFKKMREDSEYIRCQLTRSMLKMEKRYFP